MDYTGHAENVLPSEEENVYSIEGDSLTRMIFIIGNGEERFDADDFGGKARAILGDDGHSFGVSANNAFKENTLGETRVLTLQISVTDIDSTIVALPNQ